MITIYNRLLEICIKHNQIINENKFGVFGNVKSINFECLYTTDIFNHQSIIKFPDYLTINVTEETNKKDKEDIEKFFSLAFFDSSEIYFPYAGTVEFKNNKKFYFYLDKNEELCFDYIIN